jgi:nucleotide-binding universal stress UspA family protein
MKGKRKNILVPVDFSEASRTTIEQALTIADFIKGSITLLYIVEKGDFLHELFREKSEIKKIEEEAKIKLGELASSYNKTHEANLNHRVAYGKVHAKIIEIAYELEVRYIIMGKNGDFKDEAPGANTMRVIREAKNPVITIVGKEHKLNYHEVLVPIDLTKQTRIQLFNAIAFAHHYNSNLKLISVLSAGIKARKSRIFQKLKKAKKTAEENGINCSVELLRQPTVPAYKLIIDYAHLHKVDLIILMTHQEKYVSDNYIGAFAQHIIGESKIPVLTLTSEAARSPEESVLKPVIDPIGILSGGRPRSTFRARAKKSEA